MAIDFSIEPFFDDFSEDKKFHRILFRPGYAVQARELTQLQTLLQQQISRHGDHIFKEGAMVIPGQISYDLTLKYVKLEFSQNVNAEQILSTLKGNDVTNSAGLTAKIIDYALPEASGIVGVADDPYTIFVRYLNTVQDLNGNNVRNYVPGDVLTPVDTTLGTGLNLTVPDVGTFAGNASSATIERGVYYIKKNFVLAQQQLIILDKYGNTPTYRVGLQATESIIYPEEDENLLDNALGSPNYAAPGAARYVIDLTLTKLPLNSSADENFVDLLRLNNGKVIFKVDRTQYAEIEKTLARRTYDESGDYALSPFGIQVKEYRNNLRGAWRAGTPFIQGDLIAYKPSDSLTTYYFVATKNGITGSGNGPAFVTNGVISDVINDGTVSWEFISNPGFNQGINSFLTSDNRFVSFTVNDHLRLAGMLALGVEAGKAYVRGYEIEKLATEYVTSFKSRNLPAGSQALCTYFGVDQLPAITDSVTGYKTTNIDVSIGNYVIANSVKFLPNIKELPEVNLYALDLSITAGAAPTPQAATTIVAGRTYSITTVGGTPFTSIGASENIVGRVFTATASGTGIAGTGTATLINRPIGNARVRAFEKHDTGTYKVFLFDIRMNSGRDFTEVKSVYTTSSAFQCNLVLESNKAVIKEPSLNSLIFNLPDYAINNIQTTTHTAVVSLIATGTSVTANSVTTGRLEFTAPTGFEFESVLDGDNYILASNVTNAAVPSILAGTILTGSEYVYSRPTPTTIRISTSQANTNLVNNIPHTLFATIKRSASTTSQTQKTIVDATQTLTSTTVPQAVNTIVEGGSYTIAAVGTTNFTAIGAPSNTAGVVFKATTTTANGQSLLTGTGTVTTSIPSEIVLNNSYVTRIVSVLMDSRGFTLGTAPNVTPNTSPIYNTNITNRYIFSDNQDANAIKRSSIILAAGASAPIGPIQIKYEYMNDNGVNPGGFYGVGSYSYTDSNISYEQIGTASNYSLRDCIDFRPTQTSGAYIEKYFPKFGSTISVTYNNYLSRVDNISLSSAGEYINTRGVPSATSVEPTTPNSSMKLARINIEPYTFNRGNSVGALISRVENKRYTMRDIGKIERRVQDLEYYTALSLTELETKNMQVVDSAGLDRYQNGFLVDSFDGQGVGNAASDDWNASIDMQKKELRPFFSQRQVNLLENVNSATKNSYRVSGDLVTLPYTEVEVSWAKQSKASVQVPVNPYSIASYKGIVSLNPWSDTWFSTHYRPDVIVNDESQYQAIVQKAEQDGILGTVWNSWQTAFSSSRSQGTRLEALSRWSTIDTSILNAQNNGGDFWRNRTTFTGEELDFIGNTNRDVGSAQASAVAGSRVLTIETSAVETTSKRSGTRSFVVDKVDSRVVEDRVVGTQIVPFIRPRAVLFVGYGFKPSTRMYSYFDNVIVDEYVTPAIKLSTSPITNYSSIFDVERNAGTAVENATRTVHYNDGAVVDGTVTLTNGSTSVTGTGSEFLNDLSVGDTVNFGGTTGPRTQYKVASIQSNTVFTLDLAWQSETISGVSIRAIGPNRNNIQEVEVAFNHGEVIREYNAAGSPTGVSAIVVAQETVGANVILHVMNIKGGQFSNLANYSLRGEYGNVPPQVRLNSAPITQSSLTASETGVVAGIFRIPSNPILRFRTGTREFRLSDVANTDSVSRTEQELTSGGAFYEANGIVEIKQRTIIATRTADIVSQQVSDTNTIVTTNDRLTRDTGWFDPLAQTFMVQEDGGAFITSVDLFFSTKDIKIPVRIEIREVVNGYPSSRVLPFSRVEVKASNVNISTDATAVTTFKFVSPVFLQNGTEYSLVVLSDSDYYKMWCSETGTRQVLPGGGIGAAITSQPFNGVLFKSQNASTWTADQTQDMKFTIRRAQFASTPAVLELLPPKLTYASLDFNPFNFIKDNGKCRVIHRNHGMKVGQKVVFKAGQVINSINGIAANTIFRDIGHDIVSVELDAYVVNFGTNSNSTGKVGGAFIQASENYEFQTAMIDIAEIIPPGTSISYEVVTLNHILQSSSVAMINKENLDFNGERVIPSDINNLNNTTVTRGVKILATLNPASSNSVSPVIDLGRLAMTTVSNKIDSPTLAIIDSDFDIFPITTSGTPTEIGNEASTKPIKLNEAGDTIIIDALTQGTLYNNVNNNLNPGDVIRFTYSAGTDAVKNMIIVDKSFNIIYNEFGEVTSQQLRLKLEGFTSADSIYVTTDGVTVALQWLSHFKSEYASIGGTTHSKYVTKKINFARPSEMLRIMFAAVIPNDADVEIYYKTGSGVAGDFIASRYYKVTPNSYTKSENEFTEVTANIEDLEPFDSVMVKLVMKSINKGKIPRIKDFRVIAVA